jgi:hypothetical protein
VAAAGQLGISGCTGRPPAHPATHSPSFCAQAAGPVTTTSKSRPGSTWGSAPVAGPGIAKRHPSLAGAAMSSTAMAAPEAGGAPQQRRARRKRLRPPLSCLGARWKGATWRCRARRSTTGGTRCARRTPRLPGASCSAPSSASASNAAGPSIKSLVNYLLLHEPCAFIFILLPA